MTLGWVANFFILIAYIGLGSKHRGAWIFSIIGNTLWCIYAYNISLWDAFAVDLLALLLAIRALHSWKDDVCTP